LLRRHRRVIKDQIGKKSKSGQRADSQSGWLNLLLKFRDLSEPTQSAPYFFLFYLMPAGEALKAHVCKAGPRQ
jgi:hypothetical protein